MQISFKLSTKDIIRARKEIRAYKNSLQKKCNTFVARLAEEGIHVGNERRGKYAEQIVFRKDVVDNKYGATAVMIGASDPLRVEWKGPDGKNVGYDIRPILMAEFGSGWKAADNTGEGYGSVAGQFGGGQGSHPEQIHAFDQGGWWYKLPNDDEWHHSYGEDPTYPMFSAALSMRVAIRRIAREVFAT